MRGVVVHMARNKYPEETVQKILDIAYRLFMEKGYEQTSIQDIVEELGMSKGAIYHHFRSKEEILDRISSQFYEETDWFERISTDRSKTGLERLRLLFLHELQDRKKLRMDAMVQPLMKNPRVVMESLESAVNQVAPLLEALLREGLQDGSITCAYPKEMAQILLLLSNLWVNPGVFPVDREAYRQKICALQELMAASGVPMLDEELVEACLQYYNSVRQTDS